MSFYQFKTSGVFPESKKIQKNDTQVNNIQLYIHISIYRYTGDFDSKYTVYTHESRFNTRCLISKIQTC